jgi:hypothetical protein
MWKTPLGGVGIIALTSAVIGATARSRPGVSVRCGGRARMVANTWNKKW